MGGAGSIFRKKGEKDYERTISAVIWGTIKQSDDIFNQDISEIPKAHGRYLDFRYSFSIELSEDGEEVFYSHQQLSIRRTKRKTLHIDRISEWDFVFTRTRDESKNVADQVTMERDGAEKKFDTWSFSPKKTNLTDVVTRLVGAGDCLVHASRFIGSDVAVAFNLILGNRILYNPQPDAIRRPEDSAKSPGIRPDGSGLYATLLAIKGRKSVSRRMWRSYSNDDVPFQHTITLDRLTESFKLAFPALSSIDINNDPFDNQIRVRITLDSRDNIQLPLASLSDGTLKWMSLATGLITTRHIIGIEEPENFIHPAVQRHALELIREQTSDESFVLVSSHSQSIIDAARPEEVIFVKLQDSKTVTSRINDPQHVQEVVNDSGFGLSFFYLSGALQDA